MSLIRKRKYVAADWVVVLEKGRPVGQGTPAEALRQFQPVHELQPVHEHVQPANKQA